MVSGVRIIQHLQSGGIDVANRALIFVTISAIALGGSTRGAGGENITKAKKLIDLGVFAGPLGSKISPNRPGAEGDLLFKRQQAPKYSEEVELIDPLVVKKLQQEPAKPLGQKKIMGAFEKQKLPAPFYPDPFMKKLIAIKPGNVSGLAKAILEGLPNVPEEFALIIAHKMGYEASIRDQEIAMLKATVTEIGQQVKDLTQENQSNVGLVAKLEEATHTSDEKFSVQDEQQKELEEQILELKKKNDDSAQKADEFVRQGEKKIEEVKLLKTEISVKQNRISEIEEQLNSLKNQLDACRNENRSLKKENEKLRTEGEFFRQMMAKDKNLKEKYDEYLLADVELKKKQIELELKLQELENIKKLKK